MIHLRQPTREEMIDESVRRVQWAWQTSCWFFVGPQWRERIRTEFYRIAQISAPESFGEWVEVDAKTLPAEPWLCAWGPLQVQP